MANELCKLCCLRHRMELQTYAKSAVRIENVKCFTMRTPIWTTNRTMRYDRQCHLEWFNVVVSPNCSPCATRRLHIIYGHSKIVYEIVMPFKWMVIFQLTIKRSTCYCYCGCCCFVAFPRMQTIRKSSFEIVIFFFLSLRKINNFPFLIHKHNGKRNGLTTMLSSQADHRSHRRTQSQASRSWTQRTGFKIHGIFSSFESIPKEKKRQMHCSQSVRQKSI